MVSLADVLERSRTMIEEALADARAELAAVDARRTELEALIAQAEATLGETPQPSSADETMTLHNALVLVLREEGRPMTARELADVVNKRGLYRKRDGSPVEINQIHARINNYRTLFEKQGTHIQLKESPMLSTHPQSITVYRDDDDGFFEWQDDHPEGYFINTYRNPSKNYLVLHRSGCAHFKGSSDLHWTDEYVKVCSPDRADLEDWAINTVEGPVTLCGTCFG